MGHGVDQPPDRPGRVGRDRRARGSAGRRVRRLPLRRLGTKQRRDPVVPQPAADPARAGADDRRRRPPAFPAGTRGGPHRTAARHTTATWGVNGPILGPTLRVRRGDRVAVDVSNHLPETTTLHWHGMHLPAVMDGGPHQPIHPGRTWQPSWTVQQRAATLWYHPHLHHATAAHVSAARATRTAGARSCCH